METGGDDRDIVPVVSSTNGSSRESTVDEDARALSQGDIVGSTASGTITDPGDPRSTIDTIPDAAEDADDGKNTGTFYWDPEETQAKVVESTWKSGRSGSRTIRGGVNREEAAADFEILEELGRGGMGVVYKARQIRLNRMVALKVIRDDRHGDPGNLNRFEIEAEAVARLNHPNIVRIYQLGKIDGLPFVALELLEGGTLSKQMAGTPQPVRAAATLVATLARAVHAAHTAGIVHRDIKPSNVLFDEQGVPKLADFGLAKRLEVEHGETQTGQVIGTPSYMAPEQARGLGPEVGPAADIYSLGAILYEMLTGHPPLKGMTPSDTLLLVLSEDPVPPSRLRPKIPFDLETICLKSIAKDPRKRYADARAMADDLDRYLAGQTIRGRRTPLWERGLKLARRRPATSVLLGVGILATALGIAAAVHFQDMARKTARNEDARITSLRNGAVDTLFACQADLAQKRWNDVRVNITELLAHIEKEPRLRDVRAKAESLASQAKRGLDDEKAEGDARARYARFLAARDEAMFLDTRFVDFDPTRQVAATTQAARAGLGVFGSAAAGDEWALGPLPASLTQREREDVASGFYELLLVLADAIAQTPGAEPARRADEALRVVDRAASLRAPTTRAYHLRRAAYLEMKGDPAEAKRERAEAERRAPDNAFDFFLIGRELSRRSDWAAAIPYFEATTQRQPEHFWAQCLLAIGHLQTGQWSKARPSLAACLQAKPDSVWLYLLRGLANAGAGNYTLKIAPSYPKLSAAMVKEATDQFVDAETDYKKALQLLEGRDRSEVAELHYALRVNRGVIRVQRHDLEAAATDLREAIRLDDRRFDAFSALGKVYQQQGKTSEALAQFTTAIRLKPHWAPLYRGRADVLLGLEKLSPEQREAALRDLDDAIRYETPSDSLVAVDRTKQATLHYQAEALEKALEALNAAVAVDPKYAPAHRLRIQVLLDLKRYDDLIRSCDVALAATKPTAKMYELRGMAHDALHDFSGAIADYTLAISLQHDDPRLLCRRGWSYFANDAYRPAFDDFDAALRVDPANPDAHGGRGSARASLGEHRAAVADVEVALQRGGPGWRLAYNAARVYCQAATAAGAEARKTGPDAVRQVARYQDRAVALIRLALERAPADQRARILRETIQPDRALEPIRRRLRSLDGPNAE